MSTCCTLRSNDSLTLQLSLAAAHQSVYISKRLKKGEMKIINVDLPHKVITPILEWLEYHAENPIEEFIPVPLPRLRSFEGIVGEWDNHFLVKHPVLMQFHILKAAQSLGISLLVDLCCAKIAFECTQQSLSDLRRYFSLPE